MYFLPFGILGFANLETFPIECHLPVEQSVLPTRPYIQVEGSKLDNPAPSMEMEDASSLPNLSPTHCRDND